MANPYAGRSTRSFRRLRAKVLSESDICWLCGGAGADTVDHVIPLSVNPELAEEVGNLRPAHGRCNSSRGARLTDGVRPVRHSRLW
jgi:5-methylcytosine-specific restriction endonuclease McrA